MAVLIYTYTQIFVPFYEQKKSRRITGKLDQPLVVTWPNVRAYRRIYSKYIEYQTYCLLYSFVYCRFTLYRNFFLSSHGNRFCFHSIEKFYSRFCWKAFITELLFISPYALGARSNQFQWFLFVDFKRKII